MSFQIEEGIPIVIQGPRTFKPEDSGGKPAGFNTYSPVTVGTYVILIEYSSIKYAVD